MVRMQNKKENVIPSLRFCVDITKKKEKKEEIVMSVLRVSILS